AAALGGYGYARHLEAILPGKTEDLALAVAEPAGNRVPPIAAEVPSRHLYARRSLAALVFGPVKQVLDPGHQLEGIPLGDDVGYGQLVFHQVFEHGVELLVGRQAVLVLLVRSQLGRRRTRDRALRHHDTRRT